MSNKIIKVGLKLLILSVATKNLWGTLSATSEIIMTPLLDCEPVEVFSNPQPESSPDPGPVESVGEAEEL
jgi:hypothetical protein